ncbi:hypothetical protein OHA25_42840 [Nonomuraea sp. NBC_00507]|uniref:hypothetical protein n=1 Tax=Nonomuraea sp. NBC_00507 TaxID=2976002 RepID=UPI002E192104
MRVQLTAFLGLLFSRMTFAWLTCYTMAIDKARALFDHSRVRRAMEAVTGAVLQGFGVRLALSQRSRGSPYGRRRRDPRGTGR